MTLALTLSQPQTAVLRRLTALSPLDPVGAAMVGALTVAATCRAGRELVGEDEQAKPRFITAGWAARVKELRDGRRQILEFLLPGDPLDLTTRPHPLGEGCIVALTAVTTLDAAPLAQALADQPDRWKAISDALHVSQCLHETYLMDQIVRLGRLTAYERICHLLLECHDRLELAGLSERGCYPMPLTQEMLADATGLSTVHVNRILQQLRREKILDLRGGIACLIDRSQMQAACDYVRPTPSRWLHAPL